MTVSGKKRRTKFQDELFKKQHTEGPLTSIKHDDYCALINVKIAQPQCDPKEYEICNVNIDVDNKDFKDG